MEDKPIKLTLDVEEPTLDEVKEDEVFVLGTNDKSFDSRYYGCIKKSDVIYKLVPLIIWEDIWS